MHIINNLTICEYVYPFRSEFGFLHSNNLVEEVDSLAFFNADKLYMHDVFEYLANNERKFDLIHT
jgi:hypothetical protein